MAAAVERLQHVEVAAEAGQWTLVRRRFFRHKAALIGLTAFAVITLVSAFASVIAPYNPDTPDVVHRYADPSLQHWLGTDDLGRDQLTRLMYAGRVSLTVAAISTVISVLLGVAIGASAGHFGHWTEIILMRFTDVVLALPLLPLLLVLSAMLQGGGILARFGKNSSITVMILVLSVFGWTAIARLAHGSALALKEREFIEATRALGAGHLRVIITHLIPNSLAPIIVAATLGFGVRIILEATLSFLGLGVQEPASSWGNMLSAAQSKVLSKPILTVYPGLLIFFTVLAINFVGDGLRDALDPRLKL
jgi:peptide/nickel transport system permease protein